MWWNRRARIERRSVREVQQLLRRFGAAAHTLPAHGVLRLTDRGGHGADAAGSGPRPRAPRRAAPGDWRRRRDCPAGEPRWVLAKPKSKAGVRVVEIPEPMRPLLAAHLATLAGVHNPLELVFPSEAGTPLDPKNIRRRHFAPALKALGLTGIRQHDMRRTFIPIHVEAGTHPKLVQDRVGHSDMRLTMDVYGKIAGKMKLGTEEQARLNALAGTALPVQAPDQSPPGGAPPSSRQRRLQGRTLRKALTDGAPEKSSPAKK